MTAFTLRVAWPSCARSAAQPMCPTYLIQNLLARVGEGNVSFEAVECLVESDALLPVVKGTSDIDFLRRVIPSKGV